MMKDDDILAIVRRELANSIGGEESEAQLNREDAYNYYLGNLPGPAGDGKSSVVSTDVADTIEWIMPEVVKSFTQTNEVVKFDPLEEGDEDQAELETDYTYSVLMKENEGFIIIYSVVKDALMQKNGIIKVFYDESIETKKETYTGLSEEQLKILVSDPSVEILQITSDAIVMMGQETQTMDLDQAKQLVEQRQAEAQQIIEPLQQELNNAQQMMQSIPPHQQQAQQWMQQHQAQIQDILSQVPQIVEVSIDVKVKREKERNVIDVECLAPEAFRINSQHDSVNPQSARFTCHVEEFTRSEVIKMGYDPDVVNSIPASSSNDSDYRFENMGENVDDDDYKLDKSQELIEIYEAYLQIDVDGSGVSQLQKVVSAGCDENPTVLLDLEEVQENPFMSAAAILMSHKWLALSLYDRIKMIQEQKTGLLRSIFDNIYLINNKEYEVVASQVNMDDMMITRPGGIKRVKTPGAIREIQHTPLPQDSYQLLDYLDSIRTGRSGVTPEGNGQENMIGAQTAAGLERIMSKKEELTSLMVRCIAETCIKPLVVRIRDLLIRHPDTPKSYNFRGQWRKVDPSKWRERTHVTVRVGTGSGSTNKQVAALSKLIELQSLIKQEPGQTLVIPEKTFNAIDDFAKTAGLVGAREYFLDPRTPEGQENEQKVQQNQEQVQQQQKQLETAMAEAQAKLAEAEQVKAQAAMQAQQVKIQIESVKAQLENEKMVNNLALENQKGIASNKQFELQQQVDALKIQLEQIKSESELQLAYDKLQLEYDKLAQKDTVDQDKLDLEAEKLDMNNEQAQ